MTKKFLQFHMSVTNVPQVQSRQICLQSVILGNRFSVNYKFESCKLQARAQRQHDETRKQDS